MDETIITADGSRLSIEFDEFGEVYGCTDLAALDGDKFMRCKDCSFAECPARGKNGETI